MAVDLFQFCLILIDLFLMGKPTKDKKQESESSEEEVEEVEGGGEGEEEKLLSYLPEEEDRMMQQRMIEDIVDLAKKAKGGQKLTWNALYSLKKNEIQLNEQMNQEIQKVKERYQLLKQPIYHQIAAAALGQKVEDKLYKPEGLEATIDPSKVTPQKVEDFWGIVLDKEGLLTEQIDVDCITKVVAFRCELLCHDSNNIKITFKFGEETKYFSNMELQVQSKYDCDKNEPLRIIKNPLKYKIEKVDHSLFTLLFDESTDIHQFYNVACQLYQDYANALYYYFREEEEDSNAIHKEEEQHDEDEDDEDDDDEVEEINPKKKVKKDAAPAEKPECKNQ